MNLVARLTNLAKQSSPEVAKELREIANAREALAWAALERIAGVLRVKWPDGHYASRMWDESDKEIIEALGSVGLLTVLRDGDRIGFRWPERKGV